MCVSQLTSKRKVPAVWCVCPDEDKICDVLLTEPLASMNSAFLEVL